LIQEGAAEIRLYSDLDLDIEQWQAAQVADVFREVYGLTLTVRAKR